MNKNQYTVWQIFGIWLAGGIPMWSLGWVAYPALSAGLQPVDAGLQRMKLLTVGLIWQFVLAMIILYREEGNIRLSTISRRFWLNQTVHLQHILSELEAIPGKRLWLAAILTVSSYTIMAGYDLLGDKIY